MAKLTYPDKATGDQFTAAEATEIKTSVNTLYDLTGAASPFTEQTTGTWDIATDGPKKEITLTADTVLAIASLTSSFTGLLLVKQDATGGHTLTINDVAVNIRATGETMVGIIYVATDSTIRFYPDNGTGSGGPGGDPGSATQLDTPTLSATPVSPSQVNLAVGTVANASSYLLQWSADGSTNWLTLALAGDGTYAHTGLSASTQYFYRAKAVGDGTTYVDSNYAASNATTQPTADVVEAITWASFTGGVTDGGSGSLISGGSANTGAKASKKLVKATGNYVETTLPTPAGDQSAAILFLDNEDTAYYLYDSGLSMLAGVFQYSGTVTAQSGSSSGPTTSLSSSAAGMVLRLEISGDDILVKKNGTTAHTYTGAAAGLTHLYIKGLFSIAGANRINLVQGKGLVAI